MSFSSFSEDIFSTNRALTDVEGERIAHLLADYDNKIALLTKKIADLDAERAVLQSTAAPLRQALSPFRRLPVDVIREIFIACLNPTRNPTMSCREAPVLLTRISSGTRSVALHTPELWAAIHIPIMRHSRGNKPERKAARVSIMSARTRGVKEWLLRRSGAMPLSISVHEPPHPDLNQLLWRNPLADEILKILLKCRSRWRDVSFAMLSSSQRRLSSVKPEKAPLIRSITLRSQYPRPSYETGFWLNSPLLSAPTLRKIDNGLLHFRFLDEIYDFKTVNWGSITHLSLGRMVYGEQPLTPGFYSRFTNAVVRILRNASRLIDLQVEVWRFQTLPLPLHDEISLPFLKSLVITEHGSPSERPGLFGYLRAPALESLIYTSINAPSEISPPASLNTFIDHSPRLKELSFTISKSKYFSSRAYRQLLLSCPLLQSFRIGHADHLTGNALLSKFVLDDIEMCLCPELEYFHCAAVLHVTPKVLYDCILRKKGDVPHLKRWKALDLRVSVIPFTGPPFDSTELLQLSAGMNISLKVEKMPPIKCPLDQGLSEAEYERT